ncbi:hypothetical protein BAE44_0000041, partial [Dichanthelium oligosanthes]
LHASLVPCVHTGHGQRREEARRAGVGVVAHGGRHRPPR